MRQSFNPSLYFVADPECCGGRPLHEVVIDAVKGGVTMVQYRDKSGDKQQIAGHAAMLAELLKPYGVAFLINDHVDLAIAVSADGVHIGQGDMPAAQARAQLGNDMIIGLTAFTADHIRAVDPNIVDYVGVGPFYPTKTDKSKPILGTDYFKPLAAMAPVPVVGIGGITSQNAAAVLAAGADGIAMMRSISEAGDVQAAAHGFTNLFKSEI